MSTFGSVGTNHARCETDFHVRVRFVLLESTAALVDLLTPSRSRPRGGANDVVALTHARAIDPRVLILPPVIARCYVRRSPPFVETLDSIEREVSSRSVTERARVTPRRRPERR